MRSSKMLPYRGQFLQYHSQLAYMPRTAAMRSSPIVAIAPLAADDLLPTLATGLGTAASVALPAIALLWETFERTLESTIRTFVDQGSRSLRPTGDTWVEKLLSGLVGLIILIPITIAACLIAVPIAFLEVAIKDGWKVLIPLIAVQVFAFWSLPQTWALVMRGMGVVSLVAAGGAGMAAAFNNFEHNQEPPPSAPPPPYGRVRDEPRSSIHMVEQVTTGPGKLTQSKGWAAFSGPGSIVRSLRQVLPAVLLALTLCHQIPSAVAANMPVTSIERQSLSNRGVILMSGSPEVDMEEPHGEKIAAAYTREQMARKRATELSEPLSETEEAFESVQTTAGEDALENLPANKRLAELKAQGVSTASREYKKAEKAATQEALGSLTPGGIWKEISSGNGWGLLLFLCIFGGGYLSLFLDVFRALS
eukprot:CAMPEP_0174738082 /NCGR_PEP_ID=MMETSP1094-20130205/69324_1 /TAXON_ID=156173 /ORGANISM="Chrysochromulina brevifilum, Strain UTEX LB 985" /LENGTH=420 /DNA_ID=CAMNT_0015941425 /DNA_START=126 /DNA_END=1388 /DNA_ORIENTATION=+